MAGKTKAQGSKDTSGNWGGLRFNYKGSVPSIARKHILAAEKEAAEFLAKVHAAGGVSAATAFGMCMAHAMATGNYQLLLGVANSAAPYELPKRAPVAGDGATVDPVINISLYSETAAADDPMVRSALPPAMQPAPLAPDRPRAMTLAIDAAPKPDPVAVGEAPVPTDWADGE